MEANDISILFQRDLDRLSEEIQQFKDTSNIWKRTGSITNTSGNLCLHINGNLNHFIGAILGDTGYVRHRDLEFSDRDVPVAAMVKMTGETAEMVAKVLKTMDGEMLKKTYPLKVFGEVMSTNYFLIHLYGHLNYHLGQINYLRRIFEHA